MLQIRTHVMLTSIFITLEIILHSNPSGSFKPTKSFVNLMQIELVIKLKTECRVIVK